MSTSSMVLRSIKKTFDEVKRETQKAEVAALNRSVTSALGHTIRFIREGYNLKAKDIRSQTKIIKANHNKPTVELRVNEKAIGLIMFRAHQTRKGVTAAQRKGKRHRYQHAFIANSKKGGQRVFIRRTEQPLPIKELFGPSAMQLFSSKAAQKTLEDKFYERFNIELKRAIDFFVNK